MRYDGRNMSFQERSVRTIFQSVWAHTIFLILPYSYTGKEVPEKQAAAGLGIVSVILIFVLCGHAIWIAFLQIVIVVGLHAILRRTPSEDTGLVPPQVTIGQI